MPQRRPVGVLTRLPQNGVIYTIDDDVLLILVVHLGHRRNVYDKL